MGSKNKKYKKPAPAVKKTQAKVQQMPKPELQPQPNNLKLILIGCVAVFTFICYNYTLHNQFTNWDDGLYVQTNPYIKNLTPDNLKMILFHNITNNYYHPITMLTIAANYHFGKMNPFGYYLTNVTVHIFNTCLVFLLVFILLEAMEQKGYGKMKGKEWLAALGALCYGIHPMHVESVSWLAERKDVMYGFFYFMGLIVYVGYLRGGKMKWYDNMAFVSLLIVSVTVMWVLHEINYNLSFLGLLLVTGFAVWLFFRNRQKEKGMWIVFLLVFPLYICSLTSKPLAVVFPFSLYALDVLLRKDREKSKIWLDLIFFGSLLVSSGIVIFELAKHDMLDNGKLDAAVLILAMGAWFLSMNYSKKIDISRVVITKFPFFLISLMAGIWAWHAQKASGSVASFGTFSLFQRLAFASYGFTMYVVKAFVPFHLCSFYPYPITDSHNRIPLLYALYPLFAIMIVIVPLFLAYRAGENYLRVIIFGLGFYIFNVIFVLQFVSSGPSIMADRYSYVAYFGIFFIVVYLVQQFWERLPACRTPLKVVLGLFVCILAYLCYARTKVWHSTETLWKNVISLYPASVDSVYNAAHTQCVVEVNQGVEVAYKNLGNYYVQDVNPPDYDSAYMYYEVLEHINSRDAGVYSNLGNIWAIRHNIKKSLEEYTKSLKLDSNNFDTYLDRATTYSNMGQFDLALKDYDHAYKMDPNSEGLLENRAYTYLSLKQYQNSVNDYNKLIKINPDVPNFYFNRGIAETNMGSQQAALADFMRDLGADPKNGNCMFDISVVYNQMKDYQNALSYAIRARQAGYTVSDDYIKEIQDKINNPGK